MTDVPMPTLEYDPVPESIVATDVVVLLHVPPDVASDSVAVDPVHTEVGPVIGDKGFTVTIAITEHPAPTV